jgi:hypothetical protein
VFRIVFAVSEEEGRPAVSCNSDLSRPQLVLDTVNRQCSETLLLWKDLPLIGPIQINGTKQRPSALVMETSINFLVPVQGWVEGLAFRCDPVQNIAFESFGVITPRPGRPFVKLYNKTVVV